MCYYFMFLHLSLLIAFFSLLMQVRLDIATVIGLLAYIVNYKFESLASSP